MWSDQDGSHEDGECTGRVWLHFEEAAYAEEAVWGWRGRVTGVGIKEYRQGGWLVTVGLSAALEQCAARERGWEQWKQNGLICYRRWAIWRGS